MEKPDVVAHACNPSYLGGSDWEDEGSRPTLAKKFKSPPSQQKNLGVVAYTCHPSYCKKYK
jgi:hypothetical protein